MNRYSGSDNLKSVRSVDSFRRPAVVTIFFLWPLLAGSATYLEGATTAHIWAAIAISLACIIPMLWLLGKIHFLDWRWKTESDGIRITGLRGNTFMPWLDVQTARYGWSIAGSGRSYILKTKLQEVPVPLVDSRLEESITMYLHLFQETGQLRLLDGSTSGAVKPSEWMTLSESVETTSSIDDYPDLRTLDIISSGYLPFFSALIMLTLCLIPMTIAFTVIGTLGTSSIPALFLSIPCAQACFISLLAFIRLENIWHGFEWDWRTDNDGLSFRRVFRRVRIPWSDVRKVRRISINMIFDECWELRTNQQSVIAPISNPLFAASVWQHLRKRGILVSPKPPGSARKIWDNFRDYTPDGTMWTWRPEPKKISERINWCLYNVLLPVLCIVGLALQLTYLRKHGLPAWFSLGPFGIYVLSSMWQWSTFRSLRKHAVHSFTLNRDGFVSESPAGRISCPWDDVTYSGWRRNHWMDSWRWKDEEIYYLELCTRDRKRVCVVLDVTDDESERMILLIVRELRDAANPCALRVLKSFSVDQDLPIKTV